MGKKIGSKKAAKRLILLFALFLGILSLGFKILFLYVNSTAFTYDQARDLLDLREMMVLPKFRLIGPTTSLHGFFLGPLWYWLAFPFFILTGGHPLSFLIMNLLISVFLPIVFFLFFKEGDKKIAIFPLILYLFSFSFLQKSVYALNVNPVVFLFPLFFLFLAKFLETGNLKFLRGAILLTALSFHFEFTDGIEWLLILGLSLLFFKKLNFLGKDKFSWLFFFIPFIPQILFDFRHKFIQAKTIFTFLSGRGSSLASANLTLIGRLEERTLVFKNYLFSHSYHWLILFLSLVLFIFCFIKGKKKEQVWFFLILISFVAVFLFLIIYPYALWPWYLGTFEATFITFLGLVFGFSFFNIKNYFFKFLVGGVFGFYLYLNLARYLPTKLEKAFLDDPGNLRTRLVAIDSIYKDASGRGMKIYTFVPYVYDYPYQYLIWWQAKRKYGYLPEEYAYLPNQAEYVPAKRKVDGFIPKKETKCIYLIIEPFESQEKWFWEWRGNFEKAKKTWEIGKIKIEKLCD